MKLCKGRQQRRQKAKETAAFWMMLGVVAGVGTIAVAARWLQKKKEPATAPGFDPPARPPATAIKPPATAPKADVPPVESTGPEPVSEPKPVRGFKGTAPITPPTADDLTKIEGIGPKISGWLKEGGITTFAQLAAVTPEEIAQVLLDAGHHIANPNTWPEQAALAATGQWDELATLQSSLKGGRRVS
jgi:predicted flap endonuclease-1-like 5' DNA nuclease